MKVLIFIFVFAVGGLLQITFAQDTSTQYLEQVITDYINVKNALTIDRADSVSAYAKILSADIQNVPMKKLSSDIHKIWDQHYKELVNHANKIENSTSLKDQRKHFADLSTDFYNMIKPMEINTIDLYYQYCPMKGVYWVSEKSKISNPYFGKQMPTCGSTKETLKAK